MIKEEPQKKLLEEIDSYAYVYKPKSAVRAVVELHKPVHHTIANGHSWWDCSLCGKIYPCPTIQAIEKELL